MTRMYHQPKVIGNPLFRCDSQHPEWVTPERRSLCVPNAGGGSDNAGGGSEGKGSMPLQIPMLTCTVGRYCLVEGAAGFSVLKRNSLRGHAEGRCLSASASTTEGRNLPCGLAQLGPALLEDLRRQRAHFSHRFRLLLQ